MKLTRTRFAALSTLLATTSLACDPSHLAVVHGQVDMKDAPQEFSDLQLALLWRSTDQQFASLPRTPQCGQGLQVESQKRVNALADTQPDANFEFETGDWAIPLSSAPPASALFDLTKYGGRGVAATGYVVAYIDGDGDGKLTLSRPGFSSPDIVRGLSEERLEYLDGAYGDFKAPKLGGNEGSLDPATIAQGFNLVSRDGITAATDEPMTFKFAVAEQHIRDLARVACGETAIVQKFGGAAPAGAKLTCESGGAAIGEYLMAKWSILVETTDHCAQELASGWVCSSKDEPMPADWTCHQ